MNIGGFFELELNKGNNEYHPEAIKLSTGRACISYILKETKCQKIYVPFYCCDALFEPMIENNVEFEFYPLSENLELIKDIFLKEGEFLMYCDFFGIKSNYAKQLHSIYKEKLILDETHSFFKAGAIANFSFTSARKYFGVPDGAFLLSSEPLGKNNFPRFNDISVQHLVDRLVGKQNIAFKEYQEYESSLGSSIYAMSIVSELLLSNISFEEVRNTRNKNFQFYLQKFSSINQLDVENSKDCFCYPLLLNKRIDKKELYKCGLFVPSLWNDVLTRKNADDFPLESKFSAEILPLPIDHRYTPKDLDILVEKIFQLYDR
ncbi:MAG: hypothetical protein WD512_12540 [Candidatus Paceibacterota bacterium]